MIFDSGADGPAQGRACGEMVERVARALFDQSVAEGDYDGTWGDLEVASQGIFIVRARAAVEAMRSPTEAMQRAGFVNNRHVNAACCDRPTCIGAVTMPADKAWVAMIDAAIAEAGR